MEAAQFKHIYGPVYSWRLGVSLGIDPVSTGKKICNLDCVYCQLGRTSRFFAKREDFVPVESVVTEIRSMPPTKIDHYTFSGRGEPTLAANLAAMIRAVRQATGGRTAVITNAALIDDPRVQDDLMDADLVLAKLDAGDEEAFRAVDIPAEGIAFHNIPAGLKTFKEKFSGRLALQMMFIEENKHCAASMARLARDIGPDEIQLNTPLRPGGATPLSEEGLIGIKRHFEGLPAVTVYETERRDIRPFDEKATIRRHGNYKKQRGSDPF